MTRIARVVVPGLPHHVTQRGVRSVSIFTDDSDRELYLQLVAEQAERHGVEFLAWCLMSNHVHLVAVPRSEESLARAVGEAHRLYTRARNFREGVRGYLFQGRFGSYPVQEDGHLLAVARYVDLNPVRARLVKEPGTYEWSSARFHLDGRRSDALVTDRTLLGLVDDWREVLEERVSADDAKEMERRLSTGRPWGTEGFVARLERKLGVELTPQSPGWPRGAKRRGPRGRMKAN